MKYNCKPYCTMIVHILLGNYCKILCIVLSLKKSCLLTITKTFFLQLISINNKDFSF